MPRLSVSWTTPTISTLASAELIGGCVNRGMRTNAADGVGAVCNRVRSKAWLTSAICRRAVDLRRL